MSRLIGHWAAGAACVLTCGLMSLPAQAAMQDSIQRSFIVSPGGRLIVKAERGSIEVVSGQSNEVFIEIVPGRGDAADLEDDYEITFDQSGSDVRVNIEAPNGPRSWFSWKRRKGFRLKATVPLRFDVDLKTSGGSISADDVAGDVRGKTSGGGLKFGRIERPVGGRTSGGSIRLGEGGGDADVQTSGDSISIGTVEGSVYARTSGGSITITARIASQPQGGTASCRHRAAT